MNTVQKNYIYSVLYQLMLIFLPLITAPYIARTIGPDGVGTYSYTYSVAYYFVLFATLGISNHGNRTIALNRDDKKKMSRAFFEILTIQISMFFIATVAYVFYSLFVAQINHRIVWLQILVVFAGACDISWFFFGLEKIKLTVVRNLVIKLSTVFALFIFVKGPSDVWKYTIIMGSGTLISHLYLWIYVNKYVERTKISISGIKTHIKPIVILFVPVIAYSIYKMMDKIMLGNMSSMTQVGYYEYSEKIINIPMGIITALGTVMLPRMSHMVAKGEVEKSERYIRLSIVFLTIIAAAISFGLMGISHAFVPIYYGESFAECVGLIIMLSITIFPMAWANVVRTQYLIPQKKDNIYVLSTVLGGAINLIINYILIQKMAARGAVIGTIVAEFTVMIVQVWGIRKEIGVYKYIISTVPNIIIGLLMGISVSCLGMVIPNSIFTLVLQVAVGGIIYIGLSFLYFYFKKDEIYYQICNMIRRKR